MATPPHELFGHRLWLALRCSIVLGLVASAAAAETARSFDLPADLAERALKAFALQSVQEVLFTTATAANVRTNAVRGEHTPREAITRMLAGTPLAAAQDEQSGAWRIRRSGISSDGTGAPNQAGASGRGSLSGRVSNAATRTFLEGAVVEIAGMNRRVLTDPSGQYTFSNLPAGEYQVVTSYIGLDPARVSVSVGAGDQVQRDFELTSAIYSLEVFTVTGEREGNALAITRQRNADNVVNVVSTDAYGNVAEGNIGNFMRNLPGVGTVNEIGDVVGIVVRGAPPQWNAVNIDGVRASAAYAGSDAAVGRSTVVDQIPTDFIKEIELTKAPTPDMPADAIGGTANLITRSGLDVKENMFSYRLGQNVNVYRRHKRDLTPTGSLTYLGRVGPDRKLGVALSASYTQTNNTRDRVQMTRNFDNDRTSQARTLDDDIIRKRAGAGARFDYRPSDTIDLFANVQHSYFSFDQARIDWNFTANSGVADYARVSRMQIEAGAVPRTATNAVAGIAPGSSGTFTELLNATFVNTIGNEARHSRSTKFEIGGTLRFAREQSLGFQASFSPSVYDFTYQFMQAQRVGGLGMVVDSSRDVERPVYLQTFGPSMLAGANLMNFTTMRQVNARYSEEEVANVKVDYKRQIAGWRFPLDLKAGFNGRSQHRTFELNQPRWNYVGSDGVSGRNAATGLNDDNLAQFLESAPGYGVFNNRYPQRDKFDYWAFHRLFEANPGLFREQGTTVAAGPSFNEITEDVYAVYAMGRIGLGKASVLGGVRMEETHLEAMGSLRDPRQPSATRTTREGEYRDFFPSLHFRYEPKGGPLMRASYSTGSARADFNSIYPNTTVTYNENTGLGQVNRSDPAIKPQYSQNYDLSVEYYFEPVGVLSAGYFYKEISNFIGRETRLIPGGSGNGFDGLYENFDLVTTRNFGDATIEGYEFNYSQQFSMLPKPFNGLSAFANYTNIKTQGSYGNNSDELVRFIPENINVGLSWNIWRFGLRTKYNFQAGFLNTFNANRTLRQRTTDVGTWDFNLQYRFGSRLTAFVDVSNAFNKWLSWYNNDDPRRIIMAEVYGTRINAGISGRF